MRVRTKQRTLAQILDDTMGTAPVPVEVVSESPEHGELSALTVRIAGIFGRMDTSGALEQRLERAAIPLRSGEYIVITAAIAFMLAVAVGVVMGSPIGSFVAIALVAGIAWYLPSRRAAKRITADAGATPRRARPHGGLGRGRADLPALNRHVPA